jgi:hypothetical protein
MIISQDESFTDIKNVSSSKSPDVSGLFSCYAMLLKNATFLSYNKNVFNYFKKGV